MLGEMQATRSSYKVLHTTTSLLKTAALCRKVSNTITSPRGHTPDCKCWGLNKALYFCDIAFRC